MISPYTPSVYQNKGEAAHALCSLALVFVAVPTKINLKVVGGYGGNRYLCPIK